MYASNYLHTFVVTFCSKLHEWCELNKCNGSDIDAHLQPLTTPHTCSFRGDSAARVIVFKLERTREIERKFECKGMSVDMYVDVPNSS